MALLRSHIIHLCAATEGTESYGNLIYEEAVLRELLKHTPVIIGRSEHLGGGYTRGNHYTIIYDCYQDASTGTWLYCIYDPLSENEEDVGEYGKYLVHTYQWICDGQKGVYGLDFESDVRQWDCMIVFTVGNYTNTVPFEEST